MKISINELRLLQPIEKVVIHSLECALYTVTVLVDGQEVILVEKNGERLSRHSVMAVREFFEPYEVKAMVLRQQSPYDEMVGQPPKLKDNALEVNLGKELYPDIQVRE